MVRASIVRNSLGNFVRIKIVAVEHNYPDSRVPVCIRINVCLQVYLELRSCLEDLPHPGLGHVPHRSCAELDVSDLDGYGGPLPYLRTLLRRIEDLVPFIANMADIEASELTRYL